MSMQSGLVLVVEDEQDIRIMISKILRNGGFTVISARTGEEGILLAREHQPDVITLDRMLPGMSGLDVCQALRNDAETEELYIIMVTAMGDVEDRIDGFEGGADDYLAKPFQNQELLLRVQAAVRRISRYKGVKVEESSSEDTKAAVIYEYGRLRMDNRQHRIWIDGEEVNMTITEYKLLHHMVAKNNNLCSRGELLEHVWELPPTLNTRTVDTHVKRLRQKMGPIADYIQTVRGAGYRFCAD